MAFVFNPNQAQQSQQQNQQQISQMIQPGGGASQGQQNQQPKQQQQQQPPQNQGQAAPTKSGRFTNLSNYIQANKGYNQNQGGFAGQIYGDVSKQAQNVQQQFGQNQQQFQQQAEQNRRQYDENLANQALADPTQIANDQAKMQQFQQMRDAQYAGPTAIAGAQELTQRGQGIQELAAQGANESGRMAMLSKLYGQPSYSRGAKTLDNLLLQSNAQQLGKLNELNPLAQQLNQGLAQGQQQAADLAKQYQQEALDTQSKTRGQLGGAVTEFEKTAEQKAKEDNRSISNYVVTLIQKDLINSSPT